MESQPGSRSPGRRVAKPNTAYSNVERLRASVAQPERVCTPQNHLASPASCLHHPLHTKQERGCSIHVGDAPRLIVVQNQFEAEPLVDLPTGETDNSEVEELNTKDASEADDQTMPIPNFADIDDSGKSVEVALNNPYQDPFTRKTP